MGFKGWGVAFLCVAGLIALAANVNTDEPARVGNWFAVITAVIGLILIGVGFKEGRRRPPR